MPQPPIVPSWFPPPWCASGGPESSMTSTRTSNARAIFVEVQEGPEAARARARERHAMRLRERRNEARQEDVDVTPAPKIRGLLLAVDVEIDLDGASVQVARAIGDVDEVQIAKRILGHVAPENWIVALGRGHERRRVVPGDVRGAGVRPPAALSRGARAAAFEVDEDVGRAVVRVDADARRRPGGAFRVGEVDPGPHVLRRGDRRRARAAAARRARAAAARAPVRAGRSARRPRPAGARRIRSARPAAEERAHEEKGSSSNHLRWDTRAGEKVKPKSARSDARLARACVERRKRK